jgi:hypothetical protein
MGMPASLILGAGPVETRTTMEPTGPQTPNSSGLPKPNFSRQNPFWPDMDKIWGWLSASARPRLTAEDFLAASLWEKIQTDRHGAYCVRTPIIATLRVQGAWVMRQQVKNLWSNRKKEKCKDAKP